MCYHCGTAYSLTACLHHKWQSNHSSYPTGTILEQLDEPEIINARAQGLIPNVVQTLWTGLSVAGLFLDVAPLAVATSHTGTKARSSSAIASSAAGTP